MRFGAFYAVCNISIPFLSENAPKLKYVQTKGILGMQGHSRNARATRLQGVLQQKRASEEAQNNEEICI